MASTSTTGVNLAISGLASGMNWQNTVSQLAAAERSPETVWQKQQSTINQKNNAWGTIQSYLNNLQADVKNLSSPTLYSNFSAAISNSLDASGAADSTVATASAAAGATPGTYDFKITQLATASRMNGTAGISQPLIPDGNPADTTVGTAGFSSAVTAGVFTINGAQVTIATSDSLQQVFNNIASATSNAVTASYDAASDTIKLTSSSPIALGSAADTSNFLQAAQLYNNGTGAIASSNALGHAKLSATLTGAGLNTAVSDGGGGNGAFTINGVSINFNSSTDSLQNVLDRISSSAAGVNASYDSLNNRFVLANKTTGNLAITMQDNTGNFLSATGLSGGTLASGKNLLYNLNGSSQSLQSQSNTITSDSSTIAGLSLAVQKTGSLSVTVASDTSAVATNVQKFVADYNSVQSYIATQTATSTDATGKVTAGLLTGDVDVNNLASRLRSISLSTVSVNGLATSYSQLASLGVKSNGHDSTVVLDTAALSSMLSSNLAQVKSFFTDTTSGWATGMNAYLNNTIGDTGSLVAHQTALTNQGKSIDTQIATLEKQVAADSAMWTTEFQRMETAQSQINNQLNYLTQSINKGSL